MAFLAFAVSITCATAAEAGPGVLVEPVPMSDVALTGDWYDKQERNQEVLMSLNFSRWACHFTTAANLTKCDPGEARWLTFTKNKNGSYAMKLGFLPQGNDALPNAHVSTAKCQATCTATAACAGYTYQEAAKDVNNSKVVVDCYWKSSVAGFHGDSSNCIAPGGAGMPTCAPLPGEMGLGGYYGHYQGHWLSATAFLVNSTGNATVRAVAAANIATFAAVMETWKGKYGYDGYLFPYDPVVFDKLLAGRGAGPYYSVPFYTLHKLMAGLLDQHVYAGNSQALELVQKMAVWVHGRVEAVIGGPGGMELWQRVLGVEWGGMNDVLFNLYQHTGNGLFLKTARRFNAFVFTSRLAVGIDDLGSLPFPHANFHLPEVVGLARAYQLTGNSTDNAIVTTFLDALTTNHSYATGGSNSGECWQQPRDLGNFLDSQTEESCTQYNVLKVLRRTFITSADPSPADQYERAILNGIVGNQNRDDAGATSYIYMQPLGGANTKPWGKSDYGFPCCWGTLSESFAKLGDSIFFWQPAAAAATGREGKAPPALYVNQFVSANVKLGKLSGAVSVEQVAGFPVNPAKTTTLTVRGGGGEFAMMVRVPSWARSTAHNRVTVNGKAVAVSAPGTYLRLARVWADGDVVEVAFPMSLWVDPLNDFQPAHNATLAFMYGPLVLAGVHMDSDVWVPRGGTAGALRNPASFITRNSSTALDFEAVAANGTRIRLIPLKEVMAERYVVYFMTAGTKPPQPNNGYCPHSRGDTYDFDEPPSHNCGDHVSAGPPGPSPLPHGAAVSEHPVVVTKSRGVSWTIVDGRISQTRL